MNCELTHEEVAAYAAGEGDAAHRAHVKRHLAKCAACRERTDAIGRADRELTHPPPFAPSPEAVERTRAAIAQELAHLNPPEIMTLEEAGRMLRLSPEELGEIASELPAFELAGRIRIRRGRLLEWIAQREKRYRSAGVESQVARLLTEALEERS